MPVKTQPKRKVNINNLLLVVLLGISTVVVIAFLINIIVINGKKVDDDAIVPIETPETEPAEEVIYKIGNNATAVNQEYFDELMSAVDAEDEKQISEALAKCFVSEYYTWTNKDGNYDIGGIQYVFTDKQEDFEKYTLNNFYEDMDLYIVQNGRDHLIEVASATATAAAGDDFTAEDGTTYPCYIVDTSWEYVSGSVMDTTSIQNHAQIAVINHNGRMEIAAIGEELNFNEPESE